MTLQYAGFIDPPRAGVADDNFVSITAAGIDVKMITGDHALTARAVAEELGLGTAAGRLSGAQIDHLDDDALRQRVRDVDVIARAAPAQKLRLVEALQADGSVVATTGDGVNDAPALKRADVGVAMGVKGTEVAKETARMVLAYDNFVSITAAVREGRTIYDNIRKVIAWTLPTNGGEFLIVTAAALTGSVLPISPVQILWINMVTAVELGLTLAFEPAEPDVMRRPPRRSDAPLLNAAMVWRVILVSTLMAGVAFAMFEWSRSRGDDVAYARTVAINTIVVIEIAYLFSVRYLTMRSLTLTGLLGTPAVHVGVALTVLLQLAFTYAPTLQLVFDTRPIALADGFVILAVGAAFLLVLEGKTYVRRVATARFQGDARGTVTDG